jgi:tetratricopeptide (TPR) repeat protein
MLAAPYAASPQCSADTAQISLKASEIHGYFTRRDWAVVVRLAGPLSARSADVNFDYGLALAHLEQWPAARSALVSGARQCPGQRRFPNELAGVAFEQKRYPEAAAWLHKSLKIEPGDSYADNFAATVYYLMGNLDAALKYWNRVQKPDIAALHFDPQLRIRRQILDRAFAFSPAAVLNRLEYEATESRLRSLGIFPSYTIALNARTDGEFDAEFHAIEQNGFGSTRLAAIVSTFAGAAYETIYPSYLNARGSATNFQSLLRWDKEKRRAWLSVSAPLNARPDWRWQLSADARNENWVIRRSFTGDAPPLGSLNLELESITAAVTAIASGRLQWSTAAELSHRTFRNITDGSALNPELTSHGYQFKYRAAIEGKVFTVPERRFSVTAGASSETARLWSSSAHIFEKLEGSALARWFPLAQADTYEFSQRLRAGRIFATAPFDELYLLGMERDSDLDLRGQIGTRDGREGSSPLGDQYFLSNTDFSRRLYSNGLFTIQAGPLFDIAKVGAPTSGLSTKQWIFDTGVAAKFTVLGTSVVLTYGHDLRDGSNAFYGTLAR